PKFFREQNPRSFLLLSAFTQAISLTSTFPNIYICVHMILGLPEETYDDMIEGANALASLPIHGIKLHPLHVVKDTFLEKLYHEGKYTSLEFDEYVILCCDFLERIPPSITVQRITADAPEDLLIGPLWVSRKMAILNAIDNEFKRRKTYQGALYQK
ncbi:TIGR01212 family radical SAM protein, partial [Candidatus Omnitrophota bacterium]